MNSGSYVKINLVNQSVKKVLKTCKGIVRFKYYPYLCIGFKNKQIINLKKRKKIMASMSYCCIENRTGDMERVINKFTNHKENVQANPYEKACMKSFYKLCKEYVEEYEKYLEDEEAYIAEHSAPGYDDED